MPVSENKNLNRKETYQESPGLYTPGVVDKTPSSQKAPGRQAEYPGKVK